MRKTKLGSDLRQRQIRLGEVDPVIIRTLSDDDIIDAYITCSCCGEKQVTGKALLRAIEQAVSTDDFLTICAETAESLSRARALAKFATQHHGH